jgi:hypothetical protein
MQAHQIKLDCALGHARPAVAAGRAAHGADTDWDRP